jgi:SAM-dependent methyltransferase
MTEGSKVVSPNPKAAPPGPEQRTPAGRPTSLINTLYENFVQRWQRNPATDFMARLQADLEQKPADILTDISPNDTMFTPNWEQHYFAVGMSALRCIRLAMLAAGKVDVQTILDLPCGHGRVQRTLRAAFPHARITGCDLDQDGVDFCASRFRAVPIYSAERPHDIPLSDQFDLIWCGSLFTHFDQRLWEEFLDFFQATLCPGGLLVFTVHGRESVHWVRSGKFTYHLADPAAILRDYDRCGFGYQDYTAHTHRNYGISLSSPSWVTQLLAKRPRLRVVNYTEKGLDNHQDVVACVRAKETPV